MNPTAEARRSTLAAGRPVWRPMTLDGLLDEAAAWFGARDHIVTDERSWTYDQVRDWSERIAGGLTAARISPGDHVAIVLANYPEFAALKYAIARVGAVCVPVNFLNRRDELGYVLRQSDAAMLITMDAFRGLDYLAMLDDLAPG